MVDLYRGVIIIYFSFLILFIGCKFVPHREVEQWLTRQAHNLKIAGSNPALATLFIQGFLNRCSSSLFYYPVTQTQKNH